MCAVFEVQTTCFRRLLIWNQLNLKNNILRLSVQRFVGYTQLKSETCSDKGYLPFEEKVWVKIAAFEVYRQSMMMSISGYSRWQAVNSQEVYVINYGCVFWLVLCRYVLGYLSVIIFHSNVVAPQKYLDVLFINLIECHVIKFIHSFIQFIWYFRKQTNTKGHSSIISNNTY